MFTPPDAAGLAVGVAATYSDIRKVTGNDRLSFGSGGSLQPAEALKTDAEMVRVMSNMTAL